MKIVIDIPDHLYSVIKNKQCTMVNLLTKAVESGIPLPKGHGRLIDAYALVNYIKEDADEWDKYALAYVEDAPTIIEADKESGNDI